MLDIMLNIHRSVWLLLVIVFVIAYINLTKGKEKGYKIPHHIARLFYVLMIVSGVYLLISYGFPINYTVKSILALWLIYLMEVILGRTKRGELTGSQRTYYWVQFAIALILIIMIGYNVIL
ncbi:DUF1516 family protein [Thalassorhabdus alkalitolerans]|uniref:DUF1516 family protein n=1 Tax=Thalassorhabdus alkalitolerans TaxID=2282697 RepID=A0ABW0YJS5_9BACI|nr:MULTISPECIES: DUF1516 family protein [Bacillaceae]